jgi:hypothetical protein
LWILIGLYFLSFVPQYLGGGYVLMESGRLRISGSFFIDEPLPDIAVWQPRWGICQPNYSWPNGRVSSRRDTFGSIYYPLIRIAQLQYKPVPVVDNNYRPINKDVISALRPHPHHECGTLIEKIQRNGFESLGH